MYHQPLRGEVVFGTPGTPVLSGLPSATISEGRFRLTLRTSEGDRSIPRNRDFALGAWRVRVDGQRGRSSVTVFGSLPDVHHPGWYPYDAAYKLEGVLERPERRDTKWMLTMDGVEIEATLAGSLLLAVNGDTVRLVVYRMPQPGTEESELNIFFRDATNADTTYPAGRFVALIPAGSDRFVIDFNRARNPFCAYNSIFPCPLPWRGNAIEHRVEAGEKYDAKDVRGMN